VLQVLVVVAAAFEFESRDDVPQVLNPIGAYERIGLNCAHATSSPYWSRSAALPPFVPGVFILPTVLGLIGSAVSAVPELIFTCLSMVGLGTIVTDPTYQHHLVGLDPKTVLATSPGFLPVQEYCVELCVSSIQDVASTIGELSIDADKGSLVLVIEDPVRV